MSEVAKLCHVCGKVAVNTCGLCGRPACDLHFDAKLGLCSMCKGGKRLAGRRKT